MADETNIGTAQPGAQAELPRVVPSFGEFQEDPAGYLKGEKTPQAQATQPTAQPGESDSILGAQAQEPAAEGTQPTAEAGAQAEPEAGAAEGPQAGAEEKKEGEGEEPAPAAGGLL